MYNPGIGKFLSVDPLAPDYPFYTPYQFAGNKPVRATDLDGLEEEIKWRGIIADRNAPKLGTTREEYLGIEYGNLAYNSYLGVKYTAQGAATYGSMGWTSFYNGANWAFTGSTQGSMTYTNYWTGEEVRHGTRESDQVQQQVAWLAVQEGALIVSGKVVGGIIGTAAARAMRS